MQMALTIGRLLGRARKMIKNTEIYTHIVDFADDEFVSKIAKNADECKALADSGFDYLCATPEGYVLFRKRK
jgi:hypothetical protein